MNEIVVSNLMPQTQEAKYQMASVLCKSGLIPSGLNSPEKVFVALQWGHELGLSPMVAVNNVAVINGKPTLSADIMSAVVKRSPEYGGIKWLEMSDTKAECEITRILPNGEKEVQRSCFTMEDAVKAGLANRDVWKKYPRRMLKHRCLSYGLKDVFPDLLAGLYDPEEMESVQTETTTERNITPKEEPKTTVEEPKADVIEAELVDDRQKLKDIIEKYEAEMNVKNQNGNPYEMACEALADNNPENISKMLVRCQKYLSYKGIQVA
jgi:hypothetical protein